MSKKRELTPEELEDAKCELFRKCLEMIGARRKIAIIPVEGDSDALRTQLIETMNRFHFMSDYGTKVATITGNPDAPVFYCTPLAFRSVYEGTPAGEIWLGDKRRREHTRVIFDPTKQLDPEAYNLWTDFAVKPSEEGSWELLQHHIREHVCGGVQEYAEYLLNWMAFAVQRLGERPGVAVVLKGGRGVGKNTLIEDAFGRVFGSHYFVANSPGELTGRFNGQLQAALLVFANEGFWAGDKAAEGRLKALITDPFRGVERKGRDIVRDLNLTRLMIASNEDWVIPAGKDERRFFVLEVKVPWENGTPEHEEFFTQLHAELDAGGRERMLYDLLERDISKFHPRNVPQTEALTEQKIQSLNLVQRWYFDRLHEGWWPGTKDLWVDPFKLSAPYENFLETAGGSYKPSHQQWLGQLRKLLPKCGYTVAFRQTDDRVRMYQMPPLELCRAEWDRQFRSTTEWPDAGQADRASGFTTADVVSLRAPG